MPGINGRRYGRAEIDITQPHDQISGVEHDLFDVLKGRETIYPPDELDIVGAPGRIVADRGHVFVDGLINCRVLPAQRQIDHAGGDFEILQPGQLLLQTEQALHQAIFA